MFTVIKDYLMRVEAWVHGKFVRTSYSVYVGLLVLSLTSMVWSGVYSSSSSEAKAARPSSQGVYELTPCHSTPAEPPLIVITPDGVEIPTTRVIYHLDSLMLQVVGYPRVFCDGFE